MIIRPGVTLSVIEYVSIDTSTSRLRFVTMITQKKTPALSLNALWDESIHQYSSTRTLPMLLVRVVLAVLAVLDADEKKERHVVKQHIKLSMTASVTLKSRMKINIPSATINSSMKCRPKIKTMQL